MKDRPAYQKWHRKNRRSIERNEVVTDTVQSYFIISDVLAHLRALALTNYDLAESFNLRNKHDIRRGLVSRLKLRTLPLPERVRLEEEEEVRKKISFYKKLSEKLLPLNDEQKEHIPHKLYAISEDLMLIRARLGLPSQ